MLTSYAQIKAVGNINAEDSILEPHLIRASIEMKKIISSAKYAELAAKEDDDEDLIACALAEAKFANYYAAPSLNTETQGSGYIQTKGWDQSRSDMMRQDELEKLRQKHYDDAMDLLQPYITQPEPVDDETPVDEVIGGNYRLSAL
jgi:hypothetical protein